MSGPALCEMCGAPNGSLGHSTLAQEPTSRMWACDQCFDLERTKFEGDHRRAGTWHDYVMSETFR